MVEKGAESAGVCVRAGRGRPGGEKKKKTNAGRAPLRHRTLTGHHTRPTTSAVQAALPALRAGYLPFRDGQAGQGQGGGGRGAGHSSRGQLRERPLAMEPSSSAPPAPAARQFQAGRPPFQAVSHGGPPGMVRAPGARTKKGRGRGRGACAVTPKMIRSSLCCLSTAPPPRARHFRCWPVAAHPLGRCGPTCPARPGRGGCVCPVGEAPQNGPFWTAENRVCGRFSFARGPERAFFPLSLLLSPPAHQPPAHPRRTDVAYLLRIP